MRCWQISLLSAGEGIIKVLPMDDARGALHRNPLGASMMLALFFAQKLA
jgi:hypothetical protein